MFDYGKSLKSPFKQTIIYKNNYLQEILYFRPLSIKENTPFK